MPNLTPNYNLYKPLVNNATDQDLWGGYLNDDMDIIDSQLKIASDWGTSTKTSNYTITTSDRKVFFLVDATSGNIVITLPTAVGNSGFECAVKKIDATANTVTIDGNGAELVDGSANVVLTQKDEAYQLASNNVGFYRLNYQNQRTLIQTVVNQFSTVDTVTAIVPYDNTKPQNTEGEQIATLTITPQRVGNKIFIEGFINMSSSSGSGTYGLFLFKDSDVDAIQVSSFNIADNGGICTIPIKWEYDVSVANTPINFNLRAGVLTTSGTITINGVSGSPLFGGAMSSVFMATETTV